MELRDLVERHPVHVILRSHILHVFASFAVAADFLVVNVSESQIILKNKLQLAF